MLNRALLFCNVGGGTNQTVGEAGEMGFGVGVYGGDPSDLTAMGLSPMDGTDDPTSENYGNYQHTNGSIMCFVPACCFRFGYATAPSYSRDGALAVEVADATQFSAFQHNGKFVTADMGDGWILPRAFVDGGLMKNGFFFDKYLNSKDSTGKLAISVKNGEPLSLYSSSSYYPSSTMGADADGNTCVGQCYDAITLGRARGEHYSCATAFQWAVIGILSVAHGQASNSADFCAWFDSNRTTNFPKGNNANTTAAAKDTNDSSVTFTNASQYSYFNKCGSGVPFAKTTHNGQNNGISDINGNKWQPVIGLYYNSGVVSLKTSLKAHSVTKGNVATTGNYGNAISSHGSWSYLPPWSSSKSGGHWALNGIYGSNEGSSNGGNAAMFGNDRHYVIESGYPMPRFGGYYSYGSNAGVFSRSGDSWAGSGGDFGCRSAGYAP